MKSTARRLVLPALIGVGMLLAVPAKAEMIEEIVAEINGTIITSSELEAEEKMMIAEAFRRWSGTELEEQLEAMRESLLLQMVDRKILTDRAQLLYDMEKMREAFYLQFRESQKIETEEEFQRLLAQEGMTLDSLKDRLVEMFAPDEVRRFEVGGRVAASNEELEAFYSEHPDQFQQPGTVSLLEIVLLADTDEKRDARLPEATELLEKIRAGEDFGELAGEFSEAGTKASGGSLGTLKKEDLADHLNAVAWDLPVGETSGILETPFGLSLIKVVERTDDNMLTLDEVRTPLRNMLEEKKYQEDLEVFMVKARAEAEWCVRPKFRDQLVVESPECKEL
jgi:peptidyl-prolyl cis-trans isomerase SurA